MTTMTAMTALLALAAPGCSYDRTEATGGDGAVVDAAPDGTPTDATDAAIDSPDASTALGLQSTEIPLRIATGTTVALGLTVRGVAGATVAWSITSGGGNFAPATGQVVLDGDGLGPVATMYTAPATAGDRDHVVMLTAATTAAPHFATLVRTLDVAGEAAPFSDNAGISINANFLYGQQVFLPRDAVVMTLGLHAQLGGYSGRLALYDLGAGAPRDLLVGSALVPIVANGNELAVTPTLVPSGSYWLMGNFSGTAQIKRNAAVDVGQAFVAAATSAPLPATVAGATAVNNRTLNFYVRFAD